MAPACPYPSRARNKQPVSSWKTRYYAHAYREVIISTNKDHPLRYSRRMVHVEGIFPKPCKISRRYHEASGSIHRCASWPPSATNHPIWTPKERMAWLAKSEEDSDFASEWSLCRICPFPFPRILVLPQFNAASTSFQLSPKMLSKRSYVQLGFDLQMKSRTITSAPSLL